MTNLLCVALGGALGATLRHLAGLLIGNTAKGCFPWATFAVNITGCLAIGFLSVVLTSGVASLRQEHLRMLLITGVCGGFTTFSTFSRESVTLLQDGHAAMCLAYVAGSFVAGLAAVVAGIWMARTLV